MKKFIAPIAALILSVTPMSATAETWEDVCREVSLLAKETMSYRQQSGATLAFMLNYIDGIEGDEDVKGIWRSLAREAFSRPQYTSQTYIEREKSEFANISHLACLQAGV